MDGNSRPRTSKTLATTAAPIATYPGSAGAGHVVHLQHAKWAQEQIFHAANE